MFYSEEQIEEVRSRSPIVDIIGSYVHLTKKGGSYFGLCPFHNEKSPSFSVSPQRQTYHCFGCGVGGNVITFIMDYENYTFPEAMEMLADRAGISLPKQEYTAEMFKEQNEKTVMLNIHKDAAYFFCAVLRSEAGKAGRAYLEKRQVSPEMIRAFGLGYAPKNPSALYNHLKSKGYTDPQIKDSGLCFIDERGGRDRFWNRVMFPIMDNNNRVIGFGGRVMGDGEPKYLNSNETKIFDKSRNLYGMNAARRSREKYLLVCEGYMDVIAMHQAGFTNAVASLGTAFTAQHGMLLKRYTDEIILCYDSDGPGQKAASRAIAILKESGLRIKVLNLEPYKDPDEFIKALGREEFEERVKSALNAFLFEVKVLRKNYDFSDPEEKSGFFNETAKRLAAFTDEIERNFYTEAVAKDYGIDYSLLKNKVSHYGNQVGLMENKEETFVKRTDFAKKEKKDRGIREAQKLILTEVSDRPELFPSIKEILVPEDFPDELMREVAEKVFKGLSESPEKFNPGRVVDSFIDTDRYAEAAAIFSSSYAEELSEEERTLALKEAVLQVKKAGLERRMAMITDPGELINILAERKKLEETGVRF